MSIPVGLPAVMHIWVVEYESIGSLPRTSFFFSEVHARQWFEFCVKDGRAVPKLWVSSVDFAEVA